MRRILICMGVLGSGTALTFAAAAFAATLLPGGTVLPPNPVAWERSFVKPGIDMPVPVMPEPVPAPDLVIPEAPAGTDVAAPAVEG